MGRPKVIHQVVVLHAGGKENGDHQEQDTDGENEHGRVHGFGQGIAALVHRALRLGRQIRLAVFADSGADIHQAPADGTHFHGRPAVLSPFPHAFPKQVFCRVLPPAQHAFEFVHEGLLLSADGHGGIPELWHFSGDGEIGSKIVGFVAGTFRIYQNLFTNRRTLNLVALNLK